MVKAQAAPRANSAAEPRFESTEPERRRRARTTERRRRAQHFARRRRDLLVDGVLALVLAIVLISLTAGLGILLLLVLPLAAGLIAHRLVRHRRARRGGGAVDRARVRRRRPPAVRG